MTLLRTQSFFTHIQCLPACMSAQGLFVHRPELQSGNRYKMLYSMHMSSTVLVSEACDSNECLQVNNRYPLVPVDDYKFSSNPLEEQHADLMYSEVYDGFSITHSMFRFNGIYHTEQMCIPSIEANCNDYTNTTKYNITKFVSGPTQILITNKLEDMNIW